jgi:SAM-dependent methyltransferase
MMNDEHRRANLRNWNERAGIHARSKMYDLEGFVAAPDKLWLHPTEPAELGDVRGRTLCQLQCHLGIETLSWARLGASRVVGLDFSADALAGARELATRCGLSERARFIESDVYDGVAALAADAPFDIVYVSVGAICWLPNIAGWAAVVAALLKKGGVLYMREVHPMLNAISELAGQLIVDAPYFERTEPSSWDLAETYTEDSPKLQNVKCYEWSHGLGEIIQALLDQGLTLELLHEHRDVEFKPFPMMEEGEDGLFRLPIEARGRVPLAYSLRARKSR